MKIIFLDHYLLLISSTIPELKSFDLMYNFILNDGFWSMSMCNKIPVLFSTERQPPASLRKQKKKRKFISDKRTLNILCGLERSLKSSGQHELLAIRKGDYSVRLFKKHYVNLNLQSSFKEFESLLHLRSTLQVFVV